MTAKDDKQGLEEDLNQLEALVERLESGDLTVENALEEFENGIKLTRRCQKALKDAEQRVEILLAKGGDGEPESFELDAEK